MIELRPHQALLDQKIDEVKRQGARNVVVVSPTGSGKTVLFSHRTHKRKCPSAIIAHRGELLGQISFTLSRFDVPHRIIAPPPVIREINRTQLSELGKSAYDPNARCAVVSIQSLVANKDRFAAWGTSVGEWITDEGHHVLADNTWGKGLELFPNAAGEMYTAHSGRGDGKGLGRHAHGIADALVEGPLMRDLINAGYLVDYKIFCPPSDFDRDSLRAGSGGEFVKADVKKSTRESHILGDVVQSYIKIAHGKKGITFASDIEDAEDIASRFCAAGVPAAAVSSKTPIGERIQALAQFKEGSLWQLVNVDLFGEGYDLPALEVVSFASPTASFQRYLQQFGRVLRICDGKPFGIVIDHVGNVVAHGLPDSIRLQTLDSRPTQGAGKKDPDVIPLKKCLNIDCFRAYEAIHPCCPYCGMAPVVADRTKIAHVDGDLFELDPSTLLALRGQVEQHLVYPTPPRHLGDVVAASVRKRHWEKCQSLEVLKESMAWWAGWQQHHGLTLQQCHRAFFYRFGVDVLSAQLLDRKGAEELHMKVQDHVAALSKK